MGERMQFSTRMNSISLFIVLFGLAACTAGDEVARKPKLFYVSTSATTSTLNTASVCYVTSGTITTACTGRRRRSVNIVAVPLADVKPSQLSQEVQSSEKEMKNNREGRFLLYRITTTSISTSTSYTVTVSISAATCTPASGLNIHWALCGK